MDWFELIVFAVVVLGGLLFGGRKKRPVSDQPRPGPAARPRTAYGAPRSAQAAPRARHRPPASRAPRAEPDALTITEQILEQLRQREAPQREAPELDPLHTGEAVSLEVPERLPTVREPPKRPERIVTTSETLEPAGGASHERFHEKYLGPLVEPARRATRPRVLPTPSSARQAIVWMAVFGRPKGL